MLSSKLFNLIQTFKASVHFTTNNQSLGKQPFKTEHCTFMLLAFFNGNGCFYYWHMNGFLIRTDVLFKYNTNSQAFMKILMSVTKD